MHNRLISCRPISLALQVTNIEILSPIILNQILKRTSQTILPGVATPTISRPCLRNHHPIITITDDIAPWARSERRGDYVFPAVLRKITLAAFKMFDHITFQGGPISQKVKRFTQMGKKREEILLRSRFALYSIDVGKLSYLWCFVKKRTRQFENLLSKKGFEACMTFTIFCSSPTILIKIYSAIA